MNEIERAIEQLEEISYNIGLERDTEFSGDQEKFDMLCGKKELIDIATEICRAELDREKNPPTWNERINQMTVEEKAEWIKDYLFDAACEGVCMYNGCNGACTENIIAFFNSPYTEGEKK